VRTFSALMTIWILSVLPSYLAFAQQNSFYDQSCELLAVLDTPRLGDSIEEVARDFPSANILNEPHGSDAASPADCEDMTLTVPLMANARAGAPVPPGHAVLVLSVKQGVLRCFSLFLSGSKDDFYSNSEDIVECLLNKYGRNIDLRVELGGEGPRPVILWPQSQATVTASFEISGHYGTVLIRKGIPRSECFSAGASTLIDVSFQDREAFYAVCGLADLFRLYFDRPSETRESESHCITDSPLEHFYNDIHEAASQPATRISPITLYRISMRMNPDSDRDLFVTSSLDNVTSLPKWQLYLRASDRYVVGGQVVLGRIKLDQPSEPFWRLYRVTKTAGEEWPREGVLGFRESSREDGLDILIAAIFQEDIGGKLGSWVLAEGVIFEDWEAFQEWFDSQGTGWRIKSALDIESTYVTKTEDSGLCKESP
jgi:hypothetical protein